MRVPRSAALVAAAASLTLVLSGCQSPPEPRETDDSGCASPALTVSNLTVEGEFGQMPEVSFDAPLSPLVTQREVVIEGDGLEVVPGSTVTLDYVAFNGTTGDLVERSGYKTPGVGHAVLTLSGDSANAGVRRALLCSFAGSRVAAVVHPSDGLGLETVAALSADDPLVFVFDILDVARDNAHGEEQPADPALPIVSTPDQGSPLIGVPASEPPAEPVAATLIQGEGLTVREGSEVVLRYRAVLWRNGLMVDDNWTAGRIDPLPLADLLPGVRDALVGQRVGSRVLTVVPPAWGYGPEGDLASSITGTDTLVYVVDILATT